MNLIGLLMYRFNFSMLLVHTSYIKDETTTQTNLLFYDFLSKPVISLLSLLI